MNQLRTWAAQWGDLASVAGLMVTILGFFDCHIRYLAFENSLRNTHVKQQQPSGTGLAQHGAIADLSSQWG